MIFPPWIYYKSILLYIYIFFTGERIKRSPARLTRYPSSTASSSYLAFSVGGEEVEGEEEIKLFSRDIKIRNRERKKRRIERDAFVAPLPSHVHTHTHQGSGPGQGSQGRTQRWRRARSGSSAGSPTSKLCGIAITTNQGCYLLDQDPNLTRSHLAGECLNKDMEGSLEF